MVKIPTYEEVMARPDPVLGSIALGYTNEDAVLPQIVPTVPVQDRRGKFPYWGLEAFNIQNTLRAPRTKANATDFRVQYRPYDLEEHALDFEYEDKEREEYERIGNRTGASSALFNMERNGVRLTESQLQLGREKRGGDKLRSTDVPGEDLGTDARWDANGDPVAASRTARRAIRAASGKIMNTVLLPFEIDDVVLDHSAVKSFLGQNTEQFVTEDLLKRVFRVENVITASMIYNLGSEDTPDFHDIWGKDVIFCYMNRNPRPNELEMSLAYNFQYAQGGALEQQNPTMRWYDQNTETHIIRTKYEEKVHLVSPGCGYVYRDVIT